ncbi:MAG: AAA family ATPase [Bacteroidota bacterium]
MKQLSIFTLLTRGLEKTLRDNNPWWRGERMFGIPETRRWAFSNVLNGVQKGPTPVTVLRGPRQIGKTTLLNQVINHLLDEGVSPDCIFRVQFDELPELMKLSQPILDLTQWYSETILKSSFNKAASEGRKVYIFLDEVQNLKEWAPQLKHLVDLQPVRAVVTGSSALRIEAGRDSLAGRITTLEMGPLLLREIAALRKLGEIPPHLPSNGLAPLKQKTFWTGLRAHGEQHRVLRDQAFAAFSERGAYPIAHAREDLPWENIADALNETVIRRAIQHDLRMGPKGKKRDEHLLEEVFRLACRYIGQSPAQNLYLAELKRVMHANLGWTRVLAYLKFLDGTLLLRLIEPLELRLKKRRGASKLCLCDHALRAAWLQEVIPITPQGLEAAPHLADLAGRIAESATGYFFRSIVNLDVAHFPERNDEPEIDYVLTVGEQRIPIEVKYRRRIDHQDTLGLRSFIERAHYNAPFGILVTMLDEVATDDPRIVSIPLSSLLLLR